MARSARVHCGNGEETRIAVERTISVAMCTFNGVRFLAEQLQSIVSQTRQPNEVVICDDASADGTPDLVEEWARTAPFPVQLHVNPQRVGSTRNFEIAISKCSGSLIALSDQDDVWLKHKLAVAEDEFSRRPALGMWFTNALVTDEELRVLDRDLWSSVRLSTAARAKLDDAATAAQELMRRSYVTGATMVFDSRFVSLVLPLPVDLMYYLHDRWISTIISAVAPIGCTTEPSMLYRQHLGQQIGARDARYGLVHNNCAVGERRRQFYLDELRAVRTIVERLRERHVAIHPQVAKSLLERIKILTMRSRLSQNRMYRLAPVADALLRGLYGRHAEGFASAAKDLLV